MILTSATRPAGSHSERPKTCAALCCGTVTTALSSNPPREFKVTTFWSLPAARLVTARSWSPYPATATTPPGWPISLGKPQLYPSTILEPTRSLFCWNNGSFRILGWPSSSALPSARYGYKRSSLEMDIRRSSPQSSSAAWLRGRDQLIHGAVGCWVDLESGRLGRGRTRADRADASVIPGTDRPFAGFELPHWSGVKELALRAAAAFPWARAIGWDVAITSSGPVLIEGNERCSPSLIQMPAPRGLMPEEFQALCESLRRHRTSGDS